VQNAKTKVSHKRKFLVKAQRNFCEAKISAKICVELRFKHTINICQNLRNLWETNTRFFAAVVGVQQHWNGMMISFGRCRGRKQQLSFILFRDGVFVLNVWKQRPLCGLEKKLLALCVSLCFLCSHLHEKNEVLSPADSADAFSHLLIFKFSHLVLAQKKHAFQRALLDLN
jgi:hypothetical protein